MNEYILLAGYRRFNAVKKLGWKKINAVIYNEDKVVEIYLNDIELGDNSRKDEKSHEINELMESIKQNGLIQPVVVARIKDLTEEDFIALNLTENVQRKDLTPMETSLRLKRLVALGLNAGEIAVRMGLPKSKVDNLLYLGKDFKESQLAGVDFGGSGTQPTKKGKISFSLANNIARSRLKKQERNILINLAKKHGLTLWNIDVITRLINEGMSVHQALKAAKNYTVVSPKLIIKTLEANRLMEEYKLNSITKVVYEMLKGKIPVEKNLFYIPKSNN